MKYSDSLVSLISEDKERQRLLLLVHSLALPDCWIAAGTIRNAVWDFLHQRPPSPPTGDIDVIWFDPARKSRLQDKELESRLRQLDASVQWSVKNQSRMHAGNGDPPYHSATDAMRYWPETATAVGVRFSDGGDLEIAAPFGLNDLYESMLRPTPHFRGNKQAVFVDRVQRKRWLEQWPLLRCHLD